MSVLGILGTVHNDEMRKEFNYPLERMEKVIREFKPDIICGEIRPEDWEKYCSNKDYDGYLGPNEYRNLIIPLCEEKDIKFYPVDWFKEDLIKMDYYEGKSPNEVKKIEKEFELIMKLYNEIAKNSILPFNSREFDNIVEMKQNFQNKINSEVHKTYWIYRNNIMIDRIKEVLGNNKGKRVLCTVGAEHNYFYYNNLKKLDWEIIYPLK